MLKKGFGEAYERVFWGDPPTVDLGVDPARQAEAAMLQGILMKYDAERMQRIFSNSAAQCDNIERARTSLNESSDMSPSVRENLEQIFGAWENLIEGDENGMGGGEGVSEEGGFRGLEPIAIEQTDVAVIREGPSSSYEISFPRVSSGGSSVSRPPSGFLW